MATRLSIRISLTICTAILIHWPDRARAQEASDADEAPTEFKLPQAIDRSELPDFRQPVKVAWFKFDDIIPNTLILTLQQGVVLLFITLLLVPVERKETALLSALVFVTTCVVGLLMTATGWFAEPNGAALLIMTALSLVYATMEFVRKERLLQAWIAASAWGFFHGMLLAAPLGRVLGSPPENRFEEEVRPFAVGTGLGLTVFALVALAARKLLGRHRRSRWLLATVISGATISAGAFAVVPAIRTLGDLAPARLESLFLSLHNTFYRAFSLEDEPGVRLLMDKSLTGDLFHQHFDNMVETLRDPDSHRLVMHRLMPCTIRIKEAQPNQFVVDYCWIIVGETHSHGPQGQQGPPRRKTYKYRADYRVTRTDQGWRLSKEDYTLVEEHAAPPDAPWWMRLFNEPIEVEFPVHKHSPFAPMETASTPAEIPQ